MKKFLVTIFAFVYLIISSGFTMQFHYCMDKLSGWELNLLPTETTQCERCGMHMTNNQQGCCKDEQKIVKLSSVQKLQPQQVFLVQLMAEVGMIPYSYFISSRVITVSPKANFTGNKISTAPLPLFMQYRNYRI